VAKAAKVGVSKWVAGKIREAVPTSWPPVFLGLAAAFPDFPNLSELRKSDCEDVRSETLD